MAAVTFELNGKPQTVDVVPQMPLLWVLRDTLGLSGTKFGCGLALCGACTVHVNGQTARSCSTPISSVAGKKVTTIEGVSANPNNPVQRAWVEVDVPQCGYCQSGQIMSATALLAKTPNPTDSEIDQAMRGNICRCGTYQVIREAIHRAAQYRSAIPSGVGVPAGLQANSTGSRPVGPTLIGGVGVPAGLQANSTGSRPVGPTLIGGVGVPAGLQANSTGSRPVGPTLIGGVGVPAGLQANSTGSRPVGPTLIDGGAR